MTTQWVMGDIEKVGLLKMDFLGLRTLTLLENAVRLIQQTRSEKIDVYKLPIDDPETYQLLQRGDAKGVFQFESDGIRELLKRLRLPDTVRLLHLEFNFAAALAAAARGARPDQPPVRETWVAVARCRYQVRAHIWVIGGR